MSARLSSQLRSCARSLPFRNVVQCRNSSSSRRSLSLAKLATRPSFPLPSHQPCQSQLRIGIQVRQFSTSGTRGQRKYVRFNVDPNAPLDWRRWDLSTQIAAALGITAVSYYLYHLEQVPETGRWRFMDINPKYEAKLAEEAHRQLLSEFQGKILPANHPVTRHIRRVVVNILEANNLGRLKDQEYAPPELSRVLSRVLSASSSGSGDPNTEMEVWDPDAGKPNMEISGENVKNTREWNLLVVNDEKVANAMATYGNIIVFTGILPICKDEQGLAAVLGHEIGHVVARHASERYSSVKVLLFLAFLLELAGLDFGIARIATTLLLELPNSRKMELEADKIGLRLSSRACYDPRAAVDMQSRLAQLESKQGRLNINFIYTHPTGERRVKLLRDLLPEAFSIQASSPACDNVKVEYDAFRSAIPSLLG